MESVQPTFVEYLIYLNPQLYNVELTKAAKTLHMPVGTISASKSRLIKKGLLERQNGVCVRTKKVCVPPEVCIPLTSNLYGFLLKYKEHNLHDLPNEEAAKISELSVGGYTGARTRLYQLGVLYGDKYKITPGISVKVKEGREPSPKIHRVTYKPEANLETHQENETQQQFCTLMGEEDPIKAMQVAIDILKEQDIAEYKKQSKIERLTAEITNLESQLAQLKSQN